jgi:hypothetical protein
VSGRKEEGKKMASNELVNMLLMRLLRKTTSLSAVKVRLSEETRSTIVTAGYGDQYGSSVVSGSL